MNEKASDVMDTKKIKDYLNKNFIYYFIIFTIVITASALWFSFTARACQELFNEGASELTAIELFIISIIYTIIALLIIYIFEIPFSVAVG